MLMKLLWAGQPSWSAGPTPRTKTYVVTGYFVSSQKRPIVQFLGLYGRRVETKSPFWVLPLNTLILGINFLKCEWRGHYHRRGNIWMTAIWIHLYTFLEFYKTGGHLIFSHPHSCEYLPSLSWWYAFWVSASLVYIPHYLAIFMYCWPFAGLQTPAR